MSYGLGEPKRRLLSRIQIALIVLFTVIETATLTLWVFLVIWGIFGYDKAILVYSSGLGLLAQLALFIGLLLEHTPAIIAGDFPAKGAVQPQ